MSISLTTGSYPELLGEINAEQESQQLAMEAQEMNMSIALAFNVQ